MRLPMETLLPLLPPFRFVVVVFVVVDEKPAAKKKEELVPQQSTSEYVIKPSMRNIFFISIDQGKLEII